MDRVFAFFVGIDWASEAHQACVLDAQGKPVYEGVIPHTGSGLSQFRDRLKQIDGGDLARIAVAIEMPHGAVVESLLEWGVAVFALNPKQLDRFRDRYSPAGAKDDRRDAFVLADSLRTDAHCFRHLAVDHPTLIQLRELSRAQLELKQESVRLCNRLWSLLQRYYPQVLQLSSAADEPWIWHLLEVAPTPRAAAKLRLARVQRLLQTYHIRRHTARHVLDTLLQPPLVLAPGAVEAASEHLGLLLPRLKLLHQQRTAMDRRLRQLLDDLGTSDDPASPQREHRDVEIILSFPGIGNVVAATMLAEASRALGERDYHSLRVLSGVAPVTKRSGKRVYVDMRRACNVRLRNALYYWANVAAQRDPHLKAAYAALRQRGHSHGRALRGLADRQLKILVAMLTTDTLFDPHRRPQPASATP